MRRGKSTNWKRQYKLRHNWSRGSASISETKVADNSSKPPLLLRLHEDIVVTADVFAGLRAWRLTGNDRLIASAPLDRGAGPTSLAVDATESSSDQVHIAIGFDNGSYAIYRLAREDRMFLCRYTHVPSRNGTLYAIAYASPYLVTITEAPLLSLYRFHEELTDAASHSRFSLQGLNGQAPRDPEEPHSLQESSEGKTHNHPSAWDSKIREGDRAALLEPPTLLASLRSHTACPPISLAIRASSDCIVASIAYAMPSWTAGWSVGLQEVRLTLDGTILDSRMASAETQHSLTPTSQLQPHSQLHSLSTKDWHKIRTTGVKTPFATKPTSLSYNHPYLLSSHADNTLTLYMVVSNPKELDISAGKRLWGHTSSVSGAQVGDRGKAVSVSAFGNELRVWELEGGMRRRVSAGEASVQVRYEEKDSITTTKLGSSCGAQTLGKTSFASMLEEVVDESIITQGWVAFDEEKVVLLRQKLHGDQALVVYDFA